jgi:hypothetical protein
MHDDWHLDRVVSAIRSAAQVPGNREVADGLAKALINQQAQERAAACKREQMETEAARRQEEDAVISGLQVELRALCATDPGMTLLMARTVPRTVHSSSPVHTPQKQRTTLFDRQAGSLRACNHPYPSHEAALMSASGRFIRHE